MTPPPHLLGDMSRQSRFFLRPPPLIYPSQDERREEMERKLLIVFSNPNTAKSIIYSKHKVMCQVRQVRQVQVMKGQSGGSSLT